MGAKIIASLLLIGLLWVEAIDTDTTDKLENPKLVDGDKLRKVRQNFQEAAYSYNIYNPGVVSGVNNEESSSINSHVHSAAPLSSHATLDGSASTYYNKRFPATNQLSYANYDAQDAVHPLYQKYQNKVNNNGYSDYRFQYKNEGDYYSPLDASYGSQEKTSYQVHQLPQQEKGDDKFNREIDDAFEDEEKFLKDVDGYNHYRSSSAVNYEGPHQIETIQSKSYHKKVPAFDVSQFEHKSEQKHGEVHYHQHKHMHKHEHKQEHVHQHKQEHKHDHGHKHQHHQQHKHEHHQEHKHEHHQEHKHEHHQDHKHSHKHGHEHKHEQHHKHDHHQEHKHDHHHGHDHKSMHQHKHDHHQEHKHDHHQEHKHEHHQEHKHEHHQDHKHDHHHKHGHQHKQDHHHEHKHDHHQQHKHDHHHKHGHKHGHKSSHKHGHHHGHHKH